MPHTLNNLERVALSALREGWVASDAISELGLSRRIFERLRLMGLATASPSPRHGLRPGYAITDDGWRCIYGYTKAQMDNLPDTAPVPFRIWEWPLPESHRRMAI